MIMQRNASLFISRPARHPDSLGIEQSAVTVLRPGSPTSRPACRSDSLGVEQSAVTVLRPSSSIRRGVGGSECESAAGLAHWHRLKACGRSRSLASPQAGQAIAEGLLAMGLLAALGTAIVWLGQMQDIGLAARHAGAYAAFAAARGHFSADETRTSFFSGPAHRWMSLQGRLLLEQLERDVAVQLTPRNPLAGDAQPGGPQPAASALRDAWSMEGGLLRAQVAAAPQYIRFPAARPINGVSGEDATQREMDGFVLRRHTSILTGAGHASGDDAAQARLAASALAWGRDAGGSYRLGRSVHALMEGVDAAWARPAPLFDWLSPWSGHVPGRHLRSAPRGIYENQIPAAAP